VSGRRISDLTHLMEDRVHLTGFDCSAIQALRHVQAIFCPPFYNGPRIEFWQRSNTNPAMVSCVNCWREHPRVNATFQGRIVIDVRPYSEES
jgi:hypothetical protein